MECPEDLNPVLDSEHDAIFQSLSVRTEGAVARTWNMSALTVRMLGKLLVGQASLDNISGPISIAQVAERSASVGLDHYINFIALISISLGVPNLLPVPILDGGHLLYFAAEASTSSAVRPAATGGRAGRFR